MSRLTTPTLYAQNVYGLSEDEILEAAPAAFTEVAHESRSEKFTPVSTIKLLHRLSDEGFVPTMVQQAYTRVKGKEYFARHGVRLRHMDDLGRDKEDVYEIYFRNANDGTSSFTLDDGILRTMCLNGLVTGNKKHHFSVYHMGDIEGQIVESTLAIAKDSQEVLAQVEEMKHIQLTRHEQLLLAQLSLQARFDPPKSSEIDGEEEEEEEGPKKQQTSEHARKQQEKIQEQLTIYRPERFLVPNRYQDRGDSLYLTYNTVQEHLMKGGVRSSRPNSKGSYVKTRGVNDINKGFKLNRLLWELAQGMITAKTEGPEALLAKLGMSL